MLCLSKPKDYFSYFDIDKSERWIRTRESLDFPLLMDFIDALPFKSTARMLIMYDVHGRPVPAHSGHVDTEVCHEFIWFRSNLSKPFYMLNPTTNERHYLDSYSAWFDTCNQFHGVDAAPPGLPFSIRVDGVFNDALRARIPRPAHNPASTAALWACTSG